MTEIIDEKFELKLELRLLLDAAMRHREERYDNDLTPTERDLIEANRPRRLIGSLAFKLPCGRCQL